MKKFKLSKIPFPSDLKIIKNFFSNENSEEIAKLNKNIFMQIGLAFFTIVLTVVILFAMTSAWYTNIAQTSGLVFEVEPWGFDGEIITSEKAVEAGPGDNGIVHLEAENNSDGIIDISVNVSKSGMSPEMQKRMFFYVETSATREGETMERVYVNNHEGYTYTVFNQSSLTLTEKVSNAPKLKWQWVYDVLGYYVLGTENGGSITVEEYLRPIEYDYDKATFEKTVDDEGKPIYKLLTVDGETEPEDFLYMISATDGYEGNIDTNGSIGGYYPVEVDENGYGVYAYLCSYSEIETAIMDDTKMGILAQKKANGESISEELTYRAQLNVSAQKNEAPAVSVGNAETLQEIIDSGDYNYVQLSSSINVDSLEIPDGAKIMIDLGGNTISGTAAKVVDAKPGSSVTMVNGTISGPAEGTAVNAVGAEVNMSNINISGMHYGVYVGDSNDNNVLDSTVRIVGSTIETESCAVFVSGNGLASEQKTTVVIEKSTLKSEGIVISGNGTTTGNGRWGTDINIIDSEIINENGIGAGIYQPQKDSTLTIYDSTVSGYTAIALKAGSAKIIDSTIAGTGEHNTPAFGNSGFSDTGDAVYIETGYGHDISLEIDENSVLEHFDARSLSLRVFEKDAPFVKINIISGEFKEEQPEEYIAEGSVQNGTIVSVLQSSEE
ncbi:MAG: hypothetical protein IJA05_06805 [Oscillospiraceae bacterium]|nr:hypothetical protein [Oscillospiraceae bacterium]